MRRSPLAFALLLLCCACSHTEPQAEDASIATLARPQAAARLDETNRELTELDEKIRAAQARRDLYEVQSGDDATLQNKVDSAEAEINGLLTKKGAAMHRQHLLEARLRELGAAAVEPKP